MFKHFARWCGIALSVGCLLLLPQSPVVHARPLTSGYTQSFSYWGADGEYDYNVYTPANYQVGTSVPLVVILSGCLVTASDLEAITGMDSLADQHQFIVAYLEQMPQNNAYECWNFFLSQNQYRGGLETSEIAGITQAVENNTSQWTINLHRVYLAGISSGGAMTVNMGASYPDMYAAIGVHSGVEYQAVTSFTPYASVTGGPDPSLSGYSAYQTMGSYARVVPVIDIQGTADTTVYPVNGDQVIQQWMATNCDVSSSACNMNFSYPATTTNGQVPGGYSYSVRTWNDSNGNELEEYWLVNGLGHAWSGGSGQWGDPLGPSADLAFYNFFMRFTN